MRPSRELCGVVRRMKLGTATVADFQIFLRAMQGLRDADQDLLQGQSDPYLVFRAQGAVRSWKLLINLLENAEEMEAKYER